MSHNFFVHCFQEGQKARLYAQPEELGLLAGRGRQSGCKRLVELSSERSGVLRSQRRILLARGNFLGSFLARLLRDEQRECLRTLQGSQSTEIMTPPDRSYQIFRGSNKHYYCMK